MATIPADVKKSLQSFDSTLGELEQHVTDLLKHLSDNPPEEPLQQAEVHVALARTATLLVEWYLRCEGTNPTKHPIQNEHKRMEVYVKKVKKAAAEQQLSKLRPAATLNVAATNRFIEHAIPDLTQEQRQRMKEVSRQYQQQHTAGRGRGDHKRPHPADGRPQKRGKSYDGSAKDAALAFLREAAEEARAPPKPAAPADSGDSE